MVIDDFWTFDLKTNFGTVLVSKDDSTKFDLLSQILRLKKSVNVWFAHFCSDECYLAIIITISGANVIPWIINK